MKFNRLICLVFCLFISVAAFGCAQKSLETMPPGATGAKTGDEPADHGEDQEYMYGEGELTEEELRHRAAMKKLREDPEFVQAAEVIDNRIFFDFDSYELKPESRETLQGKAQELKRWPQVQLVIEGYCDDRGTEEYNLALGERRARSAYEFLVLLGVDPGRMAIVSYGEEDPLDPANNEVAWAKNRRAEFRIVE